MKTSIFIQVFAGFVINLIGQSSSIESTAHEWNSLAIEQTEYGEKRAIFQGRSDGFDYVDANAITLGGMTSTHWVQVPKDFEELLIIKEGTVRYVTNQKSETLGAGSVVLAFPEEEYKIENSKETKATYYIIRWKDQKGGNRAYQGAFQPIVKNWNNLEFQKTAKGGRRNVIREPTSRLSEFEMHVTTLNEGEKSHDPHTHIEEEIILVRFGQVEELIDGSPYRVGPGSLIFLRSNIPHGIRNIGRGQCEYYAFKWKIPKK